MQRVFCTSYRYDDSSEDVPTTVFPRRLCHLSVSKTNLSLSLFTLSRNDFSFLPLKYHSILYFKVQRQERAFFLENAIAFTIIIRNLVNKLPKNIKKQ